MCFFRKKKSAIAKEEDALNVSRDLRTQIIGRLEQAILYAQSDVKPRIEKIRDDLLYLPPSPLESVLAIDRDISNVASRIYEESRKSDRGDKIAELDLELRNLLIKRDVEYKKYNR